MNKNSSSNNLKISFTSSIMHWHEKDNFRMMPWKQEKDPYKVWLSEIILQQTRVEQGTAYYLKFIENYPTIFDLAKAPEAQVLKLWEGLGYYSRARNLHATAKFIVNELAGIFPKTYAEILQLKGVGPYTAAAISSFCFDEAKAVLDGNVIRVLARYFSLDLPYDTSAGKRYFQDLAQELLFKHAPGKYNQAIMDFGATVCKPKLARCEICPLQQNCKAFKEAKVHELPLKKKKLVLKKRFFIAYLLQFEDSYVIQQRLENDIWKKLYQLPLLELEKLPKNKQTKLAKLFENQFHIKDYTIIDSSEVQKQKLSHQHIHIKFVHVKIRTKKALDTEKYRYTQNLANFAFPKIFIWYLQSKNLILEKE